MKRMHGWVGAALWLCAATSQAQLQKPTPQELGNRGGGGGARAGGMAGTQTVAARPPSTDPHDFSGAWRQLRQPAGGARTAGPGLPSAGTGVPDPNTNPDGNRSTVAGRLPDRVLCLPQSDPTYVGVDGPTQITQTPDTIVWTPEEMHHIRRIYLTGGPTPNLKRRYLGEATGHWDGDTLVVETRGLRALPVDAKLVERWHKNAEGNELTIEYGSVDAQGTALGASRTLKMNWAAGQQVFEWICEDYNDEWLPGGADYDDQVAQPGATGATGAAPTAP